MNTPTFLEELFFEVRHRPLVASLNDEPVKVPRYRVITGPGGVLGVKPAWLAEAEPRPPALGRHLVLDHRQADSLSQELYEQTFGVAPTPLYWVGAPPLGEKGPLGAWAAVVYGHTGYTVADVLRRPELRQDRKTGQPVADWERALWDGHEDFAQELARFEPALAFTNGFDYDDELTFYVLVTLPATAEPVPDWQWMDARPPQRPRRPVLVLKTGRFRTADIQQLHKLTGATLLAGARAAVPELALSFRRELEEFANHYYHLRQKRVEPQALVPVVLDLYDTNRNVNTIQLDASLRGRVRQRVQAARRFFGHQDSDLAGLVRFFMYANAFDPTDFDRRAAEDVLSQRDAYRNLRRRLSIRTVNDAQALPRYLAGQVKDYDAIAREL